MKRLAFVIPTMNCLHFTRQALLSIPIRLGDTIYMVDNGSTDGTLEWLEDQRRSRDMDITAFGENRGVAAAWNLGLRKAFSEGYDRALVMNNDVILAADTLPALERAHQVRGGIVSAHSVAGLNALYLVDRRATVEPRVDYACFLLDRLTFEKVGVFDEGYYPAYFEDQDFDCRAEQMGVPRGTIGDAIVCHFVSQTLHSGQLPDHAEYFERNRKRFMDRWQGYILGGRHAHRV